MAAEEEVRKASEQFYAALNRMVNGDAGPLGDIWSHDAAVTTMHPIGGREVGWDKVRESWEQVAKLASDGQVKLVDQIIRVANEVAYELGIERGKIKLAGQEVAIDHRVTNIYRREAAGWRMDPSPHRRFSGDAGCSQPAAGPKVKNLTAKLNGTCYKKYIAT